MKKIRILCFDSNFFTHWIKELYYDSNFDKGLYSN